MKGMKTRSTAVGLFWVAALSVLISLNALAQSTTHQPMTRQLITMAEHNPELKAMLIRSIQLAKEQNPDRRTNPAQTLEEYYVFLDWAAQAMPWSIIKNFPHPTPGLYDQIDQSLDYFYFINDQPLPELIDKGYYRNSLQYHEPYRTWLIQFTQEWGRYLSTPESWRHEYYLNAYQDKSFGLQNGWYEDPSNWKSFNDFFARRLKSPEVRPIAAPELPHVVASPADSKPQGVWKIDRQSNIVSGVTLKSKTFRSIHVLIGEDSPYKEAFAGGTLTHTFLDVNDYHRYHFPVGGLIKEVRVIPGDDAVGGIITWDSKFKKYGLESKAPGWQNIETRGCVILETDAYGLVALLPIGMSQVSSVNFETDVKAGRRVKKGESLGYFLFGGSDFVMLFQSHVGFTLTPDAGEHILMGEEYGRLH